MIVITISVVNDEIIINVALEISVVSIVKNHLFFKHALLEIYFSRNLFFDVVSEIRAASVVSDEIIPYLVLEISAVSVISDGIVFHVVMNISSQRS